MAIKPPVDNPNLPSFLKADLKNTLPELELMADCWDSLKDKKKSYIPREHAEPPLAWQERVDSVTYIPSPTKAIKSYVGLLGQLRAVDLPPSLQANIRNVDQNGTDFISFLSGVDARSLRDGGCYIYTEYPPVPADATSAADTLGRRPYFVQIPRDRVINWSMTTTPEGIDKLEFVVILETAEVPTGIFGTELIARYRVLEPGAWYLYEIREKQDNPSSPWSVVEVGHGETGLNHIPLRWMSASPAPFGAGDLPFYTVAELSIEYMRKRCDLNALIRKLMLPVPVRKGVLMGGLEGPGQAPPMVIGPNSAMDLPADGDFSFQTPDSSVLDPAREDLNKLEQLMQELSLAFLSGDGGQTATAVLLNQAQAESGLALMAANKETVVSQILTDWVAFTGETLTEDAGIKIDRRLLQPPMPSDQVQQLLAAVIAEKLSLETYLTLLRDGKILPANIDIEEEVKRIKSDQEDSLQRMMDTALANAAGDVMSTGPKQEDRALKSNADKGRKSLEQIPTATDPRKRN